MLTTDQKGAIAEAAIVLEAIKLGIGVFKPLSDGERYDLIFDLRPRLVRVQCKWAVRSGDAVIVRCFSCRYERGQMTRRSYTPDEIDALAAYCPEIERCYLLPVALVAGRRVIHLRLTPARNNQRSGINWAGAFEFDARLREFLGP